MSKSRESNEEVKDMPRGGNEAFKKQIGRFAANRDEARAAGRKGGKASTMTMQDFKRMANEKDAEANPKNPGETKGDTILDRIQYEAASGNMKAAKLWMEIKQFGEPKNIDITSGGERLPDIKLEMPEGMGRLARSEDEIE